MDQLLEILEDLQPDIDYETCHDLIDGHHFDSLMILSLIAELEDEFDIMIPTVEIIPENLNSMEAIWKMVVRLQEED